MKTVVAKGFLYVTPSGWSQFEQMLNDLDRMGVFRNEAVVQNISKSVVNLMNLVAAHGIILMDVKLLNMVAMGDPSSSGFDVKMVDFAPKYTTSLTMHNTIVGTALESFAFFVNGLLLLNYVFKHAKRHKKIFKKLAELVWEKWKDMEENHNVGFDFIFYEIFKEDTKRPWDKETMIRYPTPNLMTITTEAFPKQILHTFYQRLFKYGDWNILDPTMKKQIPSYIGCVANELYIRFTKEEGERSLLR
jgi:hypothetical protein